MFSLSLLLALAMAHGPVIAPPPSRRYHARVYATPVAAPAPRRAPATDPPPELTDRDRFYLARAQAKRDRKNGARLVDLAPA